MRRLLAVLLALIAMLSALPAVELDQVIPSEANAFSLVIDPYQPLTARARGMGTTGVAVTGRSDTFYVNPAALASKRFQLSVPSLQVTAYHIYDAVKGGGLDIGPGTLVNMAGGIQEGYGKLMDIDAGMSFTAYGFGLGINATVGINTFADNGRYGLESDLFGEIRAAVSLGYGHRIPLPADFSIDIGAMVRFSYLAYTDTFSAEMLSNMEGFSLDQTAVMAGFAIPIDAGINLNMPYGFSFGIVSRNMNGRYYMTAFDGFGWSYSTWYLSPTIAIDIRDFVGMCTTQDFTFRDFMYHLNIGAEVRVLSFLDLRAGLSQGYWSIGMGLDLWAFKVDVAYYRQEFGETAGDYGLDGFTIRFNIGYDR